MLCLTKIRTSSRRSARFYKCVSKTRFGLDGICNFHFSKNTLRRSEVERGCPFWERAFCRGETFQNQEKDCFEQCLGGGGRHFISRSSPFAISLSLEFKENRHALCCWRPYRVECTGSLPTSEVKRHRARLVLGWGTAWEHLKVLPAFSKGIKLMLVISARASARACARVCACACALALARARVRACVRVCVRALRYVLNEQSL